MNDTTWNLRWEDGAEGPYRVGTAEPRPISTPPASPSTDRSAPLQPTVLFLLGRGDSLELRADVADRAVQSGLRMVAVEHVGQGASPGRGAQPDYVHVDDFSTHVAAALREVDRLRGPAILLAHSMGGQVALHVLAARPDRFAAAVLTSPMWSWAGALTPSATRRIASLAVAMGAATRLAPGERPFSTESCLRMRGAAGSRAQALIEFARQHPDLVRGGSTWGWVRAASRAMEQIRRLPLETVRTAVTVVSCRDDWTVDLGAHHRVAARLPVASVLELPAGHDPFSGDPATVSHLWREIDAAAAAL